MHARSLAATAALLSLFVGAPAMAQTPAASPTRVTATPPPTPSPARAAVVAPPAARPAPQPSAPARPRTPSRSAEEPDLVQSATQVLQGVLQGGETGGETRPSARRGQALPTELLRSAGLDPTHLPGALGPMLRANPQRTERLSPTQLRQLARLARRNASLQQLGSVAESFRRADRSNAPDAEDGRPVLSAAELQRVLTRTTGGASPASLGRLVSSLLAQ